ncbi:MAG TPA: NAD(P)/FAD-dependent oxidoreductase [Vicinamibacterales bacterium]|jgi:protoporphyrinogen oxidase
MTSETEPRKRPQHTTADAPVVIIGAGPAGLTAALELCRLSIPVLVVEADDCVGGLARTVEYKGFRFDIGGHRFFTKMPAVQQMWRAMLGPDLLRRPRLSRIFYDRAFYNYPLKPLNALRNLGPSRSLAILASYARARLRPIHPEESFEDWICNRFGRRLYRTFFETYTEKVWGIPGRNISARWAAQRIRNFSLGTAIARMLTPWRGRRSGSVVTTLIEEFEYPRLGPGMMWEAFASEIERLGGRVQLKTRVSAIVNDGRTVGGVRLESEGRQWDQPASSVISTMPLSHLVEGLGTAPPSTVREAARSLTYRDFLTVALIVDQADVFPDNWIYIHDSTVKVGRIQNFKNWSPDMVPDQSQTCLGLEYFFTAGDALSGLSDRELIRLATEELGQIGLVDVARVVDGTVVRAPKAYPVYDDAYAAAVLEIRGYLTRFENLLTIGRNGTHTYNNQDHSMVMGMLAARTLMGERHDLWTVNSEDEYLEDQADSARPGGFDARQLASTQPLLPEVLARQGYTEPRVTVT